MNYKTKKKKQKTHICSVKITTISILSKIKKKKIEKEKDHK